MVHLPSKDIWDEILSSPHMARLTKAYGEHGLGITLIARCRTLEIKYCMQAEFIELFPFKSLNGILCYGLLIDDDQTSPMVLWTACKSLDEYSILEDLETKQKIIVHFYNEACVNVVSAEFISDASPKYSERLENPRFETADALVSGAQIKSSLASAKADKTRRVTLRRQGSWLGVNSDLITNGAKPISLNILNDEEGGHQEQLIGWLSDSVHPDFFELNLKCKEQKGESEFADITISYAAKSIIMESKTLAILSRENLPSRADLSGDVTKKIKKAARQLKGGCKSMHSPKAIFDEQGKTVDFKRDVPAHAICLVPDLSLVSSPDAYAADFCRRFNSTGDMFHLMDVAQLFRMVQAAQMLSANFGGTSMERFDEYLCKRYEVVMSLNTVIFDMALEIRGDAMRIRVKMGRE